MSNSSVWPIDRTLSGATTLGQSGPGSNDNAGVLCIPQSSSITRASPSDCWMSYPRHLPSIEMKLVYSTTPADGALRLSLSNFQTYIFINTILKEEKKTKWWSETNRNNKKFADPESW